MSSKAGGPTSYSESGVDIDAQDAALREVRHMFEIYLVFLLVLIRTLARVVIRRGRAWATERPWTVPCR